MSYEFYAQTEQDLVAKYPMVIPIIDSVFQDKNLNRADFFMGEAIIYDNAVPEHLEVYYIYTNDESTSLAFEITIDGSNASLKGVSLETD